MKTIVAILLLIFAPPPVTFATSAAPSVPAGSSKQDRNKAVARRVFEEIFNQGKFQVADEIYAKDFVNHGQTTDVDLEVDQAAVRWEKKTLPNLTMTVDLMLAEGDLVTVMWTLRGINTSPIGLLPATGVRIEERGITVWRIVDGKIREEWTSFDDLRILRQFVSQLKWQLMGLLGAVLLLVWLATRFVGKLGRIDSASAGRGRKPLFRQPSQPATLASAR
jgi:predicted ester cyclase